MILVSPSAEFVARLPNGKIPDRKDFVTYSAEERLRVWGDVVAACEELADELEDVLENDTLAERLQPFG